MSDKYAERAREILFQLPFPVYEQHERLVARALEQAALEARIEEREMPMPYKYSAQHRLDELRARLKELMEGKGDK